MRSEDLLELIRRRPFVPLRIHITGGGMYDIHHPDQVIVLRSRLVLGVDVDNGVPERLEHVSLVHVVRVEELSAQRPGQSE